MAANRLTCGEHWVKGEKQWLNLQLSFFLLFLKHYHRVHEKCGVADWKPQMVKHKSPCRDLFHGTGPMQPSPTASRQSETVVALFDTGGKLATVPTIPAAYMYFLTMAS